MMEIIQPCPYKVAVEVKDWKEIKDEAARLRDFLHSKFNRGNYESAYALPHTQVSESPKKFFVVNWKMKGLKEMFGTWCVVNPEIIEELYPVDNQEACMSFPFRSPKRVTRFYYIRMKYYVPFWFGILRKKVKEFKGLPAFIIQHEIQHLLGKNIYFL